MENIGKENEYVEFKESLAQLDNGLKSLTSMLNKHYKGVVYFGVKDDGDIKGLDIGKDTLMDIRNVISNKIDPKIIYNMEELKTKDNEKYIKIESSGEDVPYSFDGRYYIRNASADEKITSELLRKILASGNADIIKNIKSTKDNLTFKQLKNILEKNSVHIKSEQQIIENYNLRNNDGDFNLMAQLLSDQNEISIRIIRFAGTTKVNMIEKIEFNGKCLLEIVSEVLSYIKTIDTIKIDLSKGERIEQQLFDYESFREAFINACVHNSWAELLPPSIFLYDDRIEILSYGGIPYGLTKERFLNGDSRPVNKSLFTLFMICRFSEQSGHGIPIIKEKYGEEAFELEKDIVKVILKYSYEPDIVTIRKVNEKKTLRLTVNQKNIYELLKQNNNITLNEVSEKLNISLTSVKNTIKKLQDLQFIERVGSKKTGKWEIKL